MQITGRRKKQYLNLEWQMSFKYYLAFITEVTTCLETPYTGIEKSFFLSLLKLPSNSFVIYYTPWTPSQ
jgi:hypothetical protein